MPQPLSNVRPDPALSAIAQELGAGPGFAVNELAPARTVPARSYKYGVWDLEHMLVQHESETLAAPGTPANRVRSPQLTWLTGLVNEHKLSAEITDVERGESVNPASLERTRVQKITMELMQPIETYFRDLINDTSTIAHASPAVKWDASTGTIVIEANIDAAREVFIKQYRFEPTHIVLPPAVAQVAKRDSTIRDLRKFTDPSLLIDGGLPSKLFGLNVVVPGALLNSANPGAAASIARIWSADNVILLYVNPAAATDPSAMTAVTRVRCSYDRGFDIPIERQRHPFESAKSDLYTGYVAWDMKLSAGCVYIIDDVLT